MMEVDLGKGGVRGARDLNTTLIPRSAAIGLLFNAQQVRSPT